MGRSAASDTGNLLRVLGLIKEEDYISTFRDNLLSGGPFSAGLNIIRKIFFLIYM